MNTERTGEIDLCIAGLQMRIVTGNDQIERALRQRYRGFLVEASDPAEFTISCHPASIELGDEVKNQEPKFQQLDTQQFLLIQTRSSTDICLSLREACFKFNKLFQVGEFDYLLRITMALVVNAAGGCLFHAAGVIRDQQGYIFFGPSGAGKTTITRYSPGMVVLNDDLVVLIQHGQKWMAHSTPFSNEQPEERVNLAAPVYALYYLAQDHLVYKKEMSSGEAFGAVIAGVPVVPMLEHMDALMERCLRICQEVPIYELHFRQDSSFWNVV